MSGGTIISDKTWDVECALCSEHVGSVVQGYEARTRTEFVKALRRNGWRRTTGGLWVCPANHERD